MWLQDTFIDLIFYTFWLHKFQLATYFFTSLSTCFLNSTPALRCSKVSFHFTDVRKSNSVGKSRKNSFVFRYSEYWQPSWIFIRSSPQKECVVCYSRLPKPLTHTHSWNGHVKFHWKAFLLLYPIRIKRKIE